MLKAQPSFYRYFSIPVVFIIYAGIFYYTIYLLNYGTLYVSFLGYNMTYKKSFSVILLYLLAAGVMQFLVCF